ncbi:MAG: hypothetical protein FGF48_07780 [Candidatus Brockarchaeota archaeon]|nr:hypothetical protein [Candidatus Brockarchaeota archaeon]
MNEKKDELSEKKEKSKNEEKTLNELSKRLEELNKELEKLNKELEESKKEVSSEINNKIKDLENKGLEGLERLSEDDDLKLDNVLTVYRSLRDNHDYYLKYGDSGRFFVNEMRLKRRFIGKASSGRGIRKKLSMLLKGSSCFFMRRSRSTERAIFGQSCSCSHASSRFQSSGYAKTGQSLST